MDKPQVNWIPQCIGCLFLDRRPKSSSLLYCISFPEGIPISIIRNNTYHDHPIKGDHDIQFEPIEGDSDVPQNYASPDP